MEARPPPLPPETRTVGQLVAEAIRLYGRRFWLALPLGLPVAAADQLAVEAAVGGRIIILAALAPAFTVAYGYACALAASERPPPRRWAIALLLGTAAFLPAAFFFPWLALAAVLWLALAGLVVPVVLLEGRPPRNAIRRAFRLGRADFVHAAGSLATLVILWVVTRLALGVLLQSQADNAGRVALFLADMVLAPLIFLGSAVLYVDQAARLARPSRTGEVDSRPRRKRRSRDADLHPAEQPDRAGRPDAEVEPRSPARGQPRRRRARG